MTNITVDQLVQREVIYCVSSLISELAKQERYMEELAPVLYGDDYENAALEAGWKLEGNGFIGSHKPDTYYQTWQQCCEDENIEPQQLEFFEHWIVSNWLADELEKRGEHVVRDFLGINAIWGRQCTGQSIALDSVIEDIHRDLIARNVA